MVVVQRTLTRSRFCVKSVCGPFSLATSLPEVLELLRRGRFFANKEPGVGVTYRLCLTWAARKSRCCRFGSIFLKTRWIRALVLPRRRPHASVGRMNGKDAYFADSRAMGSNWSRESTGPVAEAHSKVAIIGGCRGGWILVTA